MNSKAIKRQLLAAIAMVLVAAIALGSSTYAWFVASGTVTATGMDVKVKAETGLSISYDNEAWGTTATAGMEAAKALFPTSTYDLIDWYHASAINEAAATAVDSTRTDITDQVFNTVDGKKVFKENTYVVMKEFKIRSAAQDALSKGLYVSDITVTGATKQMSTALRVGVKYVPASGDPKYHIYGPVVIGNGGSGNIATEGYTVYKDTTTTSGESVTQDIAGVVNFPEYGTGSGKSDLIATDAQVPFTNPLVVQIFIWFEGEDANLHTNIFNTESLSITVSFTSDVSSSS